jgi:hypothetical protein
MPVIATIEGLKDPENYVVGAFVGDECRGEGQLAVRNVMIINVAGDQNEQVTFRLMNKQTGMVTDIAEQVRYTSMLGSLQQPMKLTSPVTTGISNVTANAASRKADIFTISGQKLSAPRRGINIVGGRKVVY